MGRVRLLRRPRGEERRAPSADSWTHREMVLVLGAILATVVLPRLLLAPVVTLSPDEIAYALIGGDVLKGDWPYATGFDHKPVGLYLPYALAVAVGGQTVTTLRVMSLLVAAVTFALALLVARRLDAAIPVATFGAVVVTLVGLGNQGAASLSEHLLNLYLLLLVLAVLAHPSSLTAAAVGAVSALAVQTNYLVAPMVLVLLVLGAWRYRDDRGWAVRTAVAGVLVTCVLLAPVAVLSDLGDYLRLQLDFVRGYSATADEPGAGLDRWLAMMRGCLPLVVSVGALAAVVRGARRPSVLPWVALGAVTVGVISANGFGYPHYAILLAVPLAMALVVQVGALPPRTRTKVAGVVGVLAAASLLLPQVDVLKSGARSIVAQRSLAPDASQPDMVNAAALRQVAAPGDVVYSPNIELYYLTGTRPPTRFFFPDHHLDAGMAAALGTSVRDQMAGIVASEPVAVVLGPVYPLTDEASAVLQPYLTSRCRVHAQIGRTRTYDCRGVGTVTP